MRVYKCQKIGRLLFTTGAMKGPKGVVSFNLLVDTGSSYTILPWEHLTTIGFEPPFSAGKVRMVTASGAVFAPKIKLDRLSCFGLNFDSFVVVAHTLPAELARVGILGMDFLRKAKAKIDIHKNQIHLLA